MTVLDAESADSASAILRKSSTHVHRGCSTKRARQAKMLLPNGGTIMRVFTTSIAALAAAFAVATVAQAQEIKRTEIKRSDLTGTNMEVIMTVL